MGIRHLARQRAIQLLYAMEFAEPEATLGDAERQFLNADKLHRRGWGPFARTLATQSYERRAELDEAIRPTLKKWTLERLPIVDRLCLRMALCELAYFPDIPLRVTINEYIELARMFGNDESPTYINAVLDTLAKAFPRKDFQVREETAGEGADDTAGQPAFDPRAKLHLAIGEGETVEESKASPPESPPETPPETPHREEV
jgi:N utilization substance protein B